MNKNQILLEKGSFPKLLLNLCLPTVIVMLVMVVYNMADIFFIGQTGDPDKIAALSLCTPLFTILSGLGTLLGSGGCTAASIAFGRGEIQKIKTYTSFCFYGSLFIGGLFLVIILIILEPVSVLLGADADTLPQTCSYLRIIAIGAPVILFTNVFTNLIRSDGAAKESMIANGIGTLSNIALDALFILVFSWDVAGAALATVLGNVLSALYLIFYITRKQPAFSLSFKYFSLKPEVFGKIIPLGIPIAASTILMSFSNMLSNRLMVGHGASFLAAQSISGKIGMLITMIVMGICMGMQPAVSYNFGAGRSERMYDILKKTGIFTVVAGTCMTLACFFARNVILTSFIDNAGVVSHGRIMVFASLSTGPVYGIYQLCQTFLQSTGKASYATCAAVLDKGVFFIPILFCMNSFFGAYGIAFTGAVTLVFSIIAAVILSLKWNRSLTLQSSPPYFREAPNE